jgi:hypothetical protein
VTMHDSHNTYAFHRINWRRLRFTTTITTVNWYMKHLLWQMGLNPLVIPMHRIYGGMGGCGGRGISTEAWREQLRRCPDENGRA